ncbi:FAD-dependent oxidoreductase [Inquilinus sp. NPDC058860]|uniref:oxidoreductase n=1 Tax=Inquilinus sp. NPDC058860 TaxID=3346652 RepID=UPI0036769133
MTIAMRRAIEAPDPRYAVLFESVQIGPHRTRNRFYQTPHGTGLGYRYPEATARFREIRAEGGWGVIATEQTEIHPSSDMTPYIESRAWDDSYDAYLAKVAEAAHRHGALAALELSHGGLNTMNLFSREDPLGPVSAPLALTFPLMPEPMQSRRMDRDDIRNLRSWHRQAALRGRRAGFDIIYVYASLVLSLPAQFLSLRSNDRQDEYGGVLENRVRLLRELIEDTRDAVGDQCALAVRITLDELLSSPVDGSSEMEEFFGLVGELPDLWDVVVGGLGNESGSARFGSGSPSRAALRQVRGLTTKPILSVGCFTDPDEMVTLVRDGVLDLIGAARPAIADPFLPKKIEQGRLDQVVQCVACNLCIASDLSAAPIRCPQNPTAGVEWREGWHPERIPRRHRSALCLVVGAGPAGLESARILARAGYRVTLQDGRDEVGGRVVQEARLPGLDRWIDIVEFRRRAIESDVELVLGRAAAGAAVAEAGYDHVIVATGAAWRRDGAGRASVSAVPTAPGAEVLTPDDVLSGLKAGGRSWPKQVSIYDDDHYYLGSALAEYLVSAGVAVTFITPAAEVAIWTHKTLEQHFIQARMMALGVSIVPHRRLARIERDHAVVQNVFSGEAGAIEHEAILLVTAREPDRALYDGLKEGAAGATGSIALVGDASAPGTLAHVTYSGHRAARAIIAQDAKGH